MSKINLRKNYIPVGITVNMLPKRNLQKVHAVPFPLTPATV
jgi:hypothetical protein